MMEVLWKVAAVVLAVLVLADRLKAWSATRAAPSILPPMPRAPADTEPLPAPKLTELSHDELVKKLIQTSVELDMALRVASLKGIPVDVDLVDRKDPAHPNGRPQVSVSAKDSAGKVWQWPP